MINKDLSAASPTMLKWISRQQWDHAYAIYMMKAGRVTYNIGLQSAANSDKLFEDGVKPEDAAATELSNWQRIT